MSFFPLSIGATRTNAYCVFFSLLMLNFSCSQHCVDDKEKKDVINKLIFFSKTVPTSDDDMSKTIKMRKDHLQRSHGIFQKHLPKVKK